ncbi:MAG: DegT/DnrJ/EryC1/StrS aminotransferase family protein [Nitrospirae bacterium]|nr:MAG: DegT/DnrJ/EryC1/StrS aminotransferase family protein [Nitrospirota bacterium]
MRQVKPFYFDITDDEIAYYQQESAKILKSATLILGEYTTRFEKAFAEYIGVKHAISCNSGSTALEFLLRIKKVEGKAVLVPTNTNFATVAAIIRAGGEAVYLDMDKQTFAPSLAMVQAALKKHRAKGKTPVAGVMWVHIGGVVSPEFPQVVADCRQQGLFVMEDAAHAHGSQLKGVKSGNLADAAAFSFFPTKVMTTCEGGIITTNNDEEDYLARSFRNQGKRGMNFGGLHHDFGNSARITEPGALLGLIQLKKLPQMLAKRQKGYEIIAKALDKAGLSYVSTKHMDAASQYKLIVHVPEGRTTEDLKKRLNEVGVICGGGVYDLPCHKQPVFEGVCPGETYPGADRWCPNHVCPPLTSGMTDDDAAYVAEMLVKHLA